MPHVVLQAGGRSLLYHDMPANVFHFDGSAAVLSVVKGALWLAFLCHAASAAEANLTVAVMTMHDANLCIADGMCAP